MHRKNAEIFHQGWLVKSPPYPRGIFRARWRRRWFTLKQGELPGQFFLEYFTDTSCRKRKGVIDLDQVEQVDAGLRLDRQNIKFQHMFDMKTPNRTYYMAADSENDMRDWVMVICQVCNLQETEEKSGSSDVSKVQYQNLNPTADNETKEFMVEKEKTTVTNHDDEAATLDQKSMINEYENDDVFYRRQSNCASLPKTINSEIENNNPGGVHSKYTNLSDINRQSLDHVQGTSTSTNKKITGTIKKIPENLKLKSQDKINNNDDNDDISLYRSSGPYIPLSDCFSGSPVLFNDRGDPKTPLNSLDPKFYDVPRSHITNIGFNLTDDQPNSPKRNNLQTSSTTCERMSESKTNEKNPISVNSSPTDSEGGSTDDEWMKPKVRCRKTRPSDSSIENDSIAITAEQSYMKMASNALPLPSKRISLAMEKNQESSDTEENLTPILQIGPKESTAYVDERYDFPRSFNIQQVFSGSHMNFRTMDSLFSMHSHANLMTSTPNLVRNDIGVMQVSKMNFYSNAAPHESRRESRENNIFRFDFTNALPTNTFHAPEVNRTLKPKKELSPSLSMAKSEATDQTAPKVNRKLKPGALPKLNTMKRSEIDSSLLVGIDDLVSTADSPLPLNQSIGLGISGVTTPTTPNIENRLQYLDLDHSPPKTIHDFVGSASFSNVSTLDSSLNESIKDGPSVAYTTVDFLKTDAFNRVREDSELTRASKSRLKN
ncbi:CLUMA_CG012560, isoform A [Clunio marinus]|uniref:CLUMA_CG012560, isoform A n=1 Tax=Clunio marinus TaxID=568069 RepID=A0A1J1IK38_9DIPT|nr:CLUMA_CG012560, isoform A [Clunio marinus]